MSTKNPWIRKYREALHDPKILSLTDRQYRAWDNLLLVADDDGKLPCMKHIGFELRMTTQEAEQVVCDLIEAGLLDVDYRGSVRKLSIHGWEQRQFRSDSSTERSRKSRARKRATLPRRCGDVSATAPEAEAEADTEADTEAEHSIAVEVAAVPSLTRMMIEKKCFEAAGASINPQRLSTHNIDPIMGLIEGGYSLETDILPAIRARAARAAPGSINSWKLYALAVEESVAGRKFGRELAAASRPKPVPVDEGPKKTPQQIEADREKMFALDLSGYEEELGIGRRN